MLIWSTQNVLLPSVDEHHQRHFKMFVLKCIDQRHILYSTVKVTVRHTAVYIQR